MAGEHFYNSRSLTVPGAGPKLAEKDTDNNGASQIARHHRRIRNDFARGWRRGLCGWPEAAEVHATRTAEPSRRHLLRFRVRTFIRPLARGRQHRRRLSPEAGLPVLALLRGRGPVRRFRTHGGRGVREPQSRVGLPEHRHGRGYRGDASVAQLLVLRAPGRLSRRIAQRLRTVLDVASRRFGLAAHALALRHGRSLRLHQGAGRQGRSGALLAARHAARRF